MQMSNIEKVLRVTVDIFSSPPFYTENVCLPWVRGAILDKSYENSKFFPFFQNAIGAIDSTYFNCTPIAVEKQMAYDQKGGVMLRVEYLSLGVSYGRIPRQGILRF